MWDGWRRCTFELLNGTEPDTFLGGQHFPLIPLPHKAEKSQMTFDYRSKSWEEKAARKRLCPLLPATIAARRKADARGHWKAEHLLFQLFADPVAAPNVLRLAAIEIVQKLAGFRHSETVPGRSTIRCSCSAICLSPWATCRSACSKCEPASRDELIEEGRAWPAPILCRRERYRCLSHRRPRAKPKPVMRINGLRYIWFKSELYAG